MSSVVELKFTGVGAYRNALGQFMRGGNYSGLEQLNQQLAMKVQQQAVRNISIKRPSVSTGRLRKAIADPRNIKSTRYGFEVGVWSFLNASNAKYWRTIEEGSVEAWSTAPSEEQISGRGGMVGMILKGVWGESIEDFRQTRWGQVAVAGEPFTFHGESRGGKLRPGWNRYESLLEQWQDEDGEGSKPRFTSMIKREITPVRYMSRAFIQNREYIEGEYLKWMRSTYPDMKIVPGGVLAKGLRFNRTRGY